MIPATPSRDARRRKGWWGAWKWLLFRRLSQAGIFLLFLLGPWQDIHWLQGSLASSLVLDTLPLSDPYLLLQSLLAGHVPQTTAITGALVVAGFYLLVGGRSYCAWVCPVNPVTDAADWLRRKLNIRSGMPLQRNTRFLLLLATLATATASGTLAWEWINPATLVARAVVFGLGSSGAVLLFIFLLDALVSKRAWCGHLCPMGAFYSLLGRASLIRVHASARERCNDCMDCFVVCPEPQVIRPALKGRAGDTTMILSPQCTQCGRCIDICAQEVFQFDLRSHQRVPMKATPNREVRP